MADTTSPDDTTPEAALERARRLRERGLTDPHRPRYHVTAPSGWLNDPNGVIHWDGAYHLFYQHNPHAAAWGPPHWGHVVSDDLVRWRDLPVAIRPDMPPADLGGCWSGCAVDDDGTPTLVYTGVVGEPQGEQTTCLAVGDPTLTRWRKHPGNPVLSTPTDAGITQGSFRDPYLWREDGVWHQAIGVSIADRGQVLLYRGDDLTSWELIGPLIPEEVRDRLESDAHTWECPNFFALGDRHVLIVSLATRAALERPVAMIGRYRDHRFVPETVQPLDWGFHGLYAPLTTRDAHGRLLIWGWLQEQRDQAALLAAGWSGAMSLPRELTLSPDGRLRAAFVPELATLRGGGAALHDVDLDGTRTLDGLGGHALEVQLDLRRDDAERSGLTLIHGPDDATRVTIDWGAGILSVDRPGTSTDGKLRWEGQRAELGGGRERLSLHLYLDHSTLEMIADGEHSLSARLYPERLGEGGVELFSEGGGVRVERCEGWELEGIWG